MTTPNVYDIGDNSKHPEGAWTIRCRSRSYPAMEDGLAQGARLTVGAGVHGIASFTWDGEARSGGSQEAACRRGSRPRTPPRRRASSSTTPDDGSKLGQWTLPRPQTARRTATCQNYNLVPLRSGRDVMVSGNYQAGVWVSTSNPASPGDGGWSDPPPAGSVPLPTTAPVLHGEVVAVR